MEDLAIGVTAYKEKYGNDVSQMVWPAKAQVEEVHAGKNLDGLTALYLPKTISAGKVGNNQQASCRRPVVGTWSIYRFIH